MLKKVIQNLFHQLKRQYRIAFIDEDTLSYTRQYSFRPIVIVSGVLITAFLLVAGTASFIIFTPQVRKHIPGYSNPEYEVQVNKMQAMLDTMQKEIDERDAFLISLQKSVGVSNPFPNRHTNLQEDETAMTKTQTQTQSFASEEKPSILPKDAGTKPSILPENNSNAAVNPMKSQPTPGDAALKKGGKSKEALGLKTLVRPVLGVMREPFNPGKSHYGVDIVTKEKEIVLAATEGVVILAEYSDETGHVIGISSPTGIVTFYKHNSKLLKTKGKYVLAGEHIAVVGNTGENSNGPHLHFEIWHAGIPLNPLDYLNFAK
ncbi:MAG: M23 family metallopeptidase [Bacteroidia bacterium]